MPDSIVKRDGRVVQFDQTKIELALHKCFYSSYGDTTPYQHDIELIVEWVVDSLENVTDGSITVEKVQDLVEKGLAIFGYFEQSKHYILYRAEHAKQRAERPIPENVRQAFEEDDKYFPTQLQRFQFMDKYARWNYDAGRRETWRETVGRTINELVRVSGGRLDTSIYYTLRDAILNMDVMPSMRWLNMAGPASERDSSVIYNCSYLPISDLLAFKEIMLLGMAGCGVGYSVEKRYVSQLPIVEKQTKKPKLLCLVDDSAEGWAYALQIGLEAWFTGIDVDFDFSLVREEGAILKTKGGRASGPKPLAALLDFVRTRVLSKQGKQLSTLDVHDIACAIGNAVISGGMRRTAMISLFDVDDENMLKCKSGNFEANNSQRWNANNSAVWVDDTELTQVEFITQFMEMVNSGRGEPGIFNRSAANRMVPERRKQIGNNVLYGSNPCGEVILKPYQFCNLSVCVARPDDNLNTLVNKVELATIIGTIQSMATHFPNLRPEWRMNAERERLLGVDITGQLDCPYLLNNPDAFKTLREHAVHTNRVFSKLLGINQSAAITTVKPSGNSAQLLNCSSGLHARWAPYYIRNVRVSGSSAIAKVLLDAGAPMVPENGDDPVNPRTWVVSFPVKSPDGVPTRNDRSAITQCEWWLTNKLNWTEHNPSVTITYKPDEIVGLLHWVWNHRMQIGGMAFLQRDDAKYDNLPYIEITKDEYERRLAQFPVIDWSKVYRYESADHTTTAQELACVGGGCDNE